FFFILGDSIKASAGSAIEEGLRADYVVSVDGFSGGFSPALGEELAEEPEISEVTFLRFGFWDRDGSDEFLMAIDTETINETIFLDVQTGSVDALTDGGVLVFDTIADEEGWVVGDTVAMGLASTGLQQVEIVGTFAEANVVQANFLVGEKFYAENFSGFGTDLDFVLAVKAADGVTPDVARAVVEDAAADYANVTVRDQVEYRQSQEDQVNTILIMFNALLALAVIIAVFGITNTLALSVFERTREIGLLRAVGMGRRQIRRMVRWEAIIVAIIGSLLGIVVGLLFGITVTSALSSQGINVLSIPAVQIIGLVLFGAVAGLVAAILPARKAARLNILEAISYE
ncbi:MAG: ABC transporter permease, partial [Acidimicrobiia bacterium]